MMGLIQDFLFMLVLALAWPWFISLFDGLFQWIEEYNERHPPPK